MACLCWCGRVFLGAGGGQRQDEYVCCLCVCLYVAEEGWGLDLVATSTIQMPCRDV